MIIDWALNRNINFCSIYHIFFRYGWHQMVSYSWNIFTRPFWIQSFSMRWDVLHLKLCKKYRWSTYLLYSSVIFLKQLGTYMTSIFKNDTDSCFQLSMLRSWDSKYSNIIVIFSTILFKKKKISLFRPLFPYTSFANCKNALKTFQKLNWRCLWCR